MLKIVLTFLVVMALLALIAGPGFRKFLLRLLGISGRDR